MSDAAYLLELQQPERWCAYHLFDEDCLSAAVEACDNLAVRSGCASRVIDLTTDERDAAACWIIHESFPREEHKEVEFSWISEGF
jgi:hypothetical protein